MGPQRMYGLTPWVRRLLVANLLVFLIQSTLLTSPSFAGAFGWYWPDHPVFVFPLPDPVPAKWLVTFLVALDLVLALVGASDGIAHLAHLGGVGTALLYLRGQAWWVARGERRGRGPPSESSVLVSQPPRVSRGSSVPPSAQRGKSRGAGEPDARANAEIDRVLDKIIAT